MPYPALNSAFDALFPPGLQHYWKANFVTELTDDAIEAHLVHGPKLPAVNSTMHIYPINGACHRVAADATAFAYRDANFATVIAGMWPDPAENEAEHRSGCATTTTRRHRTPRRAATSTSWPTTTRTGSRPTTRATTTGWRGQAAVRPGQPVPPQPEHPARLTRRPLVTSCIVRVGTLTMHDARANPLRWVRTRPMTLPSGSVSGEAACHHPRHEPPAGSLHRRRVALRESC